MEPAAAEDAAAAAAVAAPDSWETTDIDGAMSRLILSAHRVASSPDLAEGEEQRPDPPAPPTQPQQQGSAAPSSRDDSAAQVDQFLREALEKPREEDYGAFTSTKAQDLAQPLVDAHIPFKIHVVKDHDMKERLCLEAERLGLSAMIMGSRGFGAHRKGGKGRLGSVSDYCVHHCVCPVVVVRYPDDAAGAGGDAAGAIDELHTVPEDEPAYHDAPEVQKGSQYSLTHWSWPF